MIFIGQWCNVLVSLPYRLSSAAALWLVTLDCITIVNYSNFYFSSCLPSFSVPYSTYFLSFPSLPQTCPLFLTSCNWMEGPQRVCSTLNLFHSLSLVHFTPVLTFLPFFTYCSWLGYLIQPPVPLPAGLEINRVVVSVLAVRLWSDGSEAA